MSVTDPLDCIIGKQIWLDYSDQNFVFDEGYTPQACKVLRRFEDQHGAKDWYLVELQTPLQYKDGEYRYLMIRSRHVGYTVGDEEVSVFLVLVPNVGELHSPYVMDRSLYIAWGTAYSDMREGKKKSFDRLRFKASWESIRNILFRIWDPLGVNDDAPDTEYEMYVGEIYRLLIGKPNLEEITEKLHQIELTRLEQETTPAHRLEVARKLLEIEINGGDAGH